MSSRPFLFVRKENESTTYAIRATNIYSLNVVPITFSFYLFIATGGGGTGKNV